jgi:hypothetical protein
MAAKPRIRALKLLAWAGLALLAGCANLPTAPDLSSDSSANTGATWARVAPAKQEGPGGTGGLSPLPGTEVELVGTRDVPGLLGGEVNAGPFTVKIPPGAFEGIGSISVTVPDPSVLRVKLHITGVLNHFNVPVTLEVDWTDRLGDPDDAGDLRMVWFDESLGSWVFIPSEVDLQKRTISTQLEHFSDYGVVEMNGVVESKAGW